MANEVSITFNFSSSKGGTTVRNGTTTHTLNMDGDQVFHSNPSIGTSAATISLGTIDTSKRYFLYVRNTDSTNYVELSPNSGTTWGDRIGPGAMLYKEVPGGLTVQHRANTAACICEIIAVESQA